jgi:transcriptional regulator with XRE-family HTH domain
MTDTAHMPLDPVKLKARREQLKLTQTEVAAAAGMPQSAYARMESGARTDPRLSTAQAVAKALRCPLGKLLA